MFRASDHFFVGCLFNILLNTLYISHRHSYNVGKVSLLNASRLYCSGFPLFPFAILFLFAIVIRVVSLYVRQLTNKINQINRHTAMRESVTTYNNSQLRN